MREISVEDKTQIKQLLYDGNVFGIKGDRFRAFGGFQLWWYDKHLDVCSYSESYWSDGIKNIHHCSLNRAVRILWHNRKSLFLRHKHLDEDKRLMFAGHFAHAGQ
ncbi:MAG: hypothetical protein U9Q07_06460 [Planctomycetota bacterium]|nr:hypothetical protein [Planctomycetota bacterium]